MVAGLGQCFVDKRKERLVGRSAAAEESMWKLNELVRVKGKLKLLFIFEVHFWNICRPLQL